MRIFSPRRTSFFRDRHDTDGVRVNEGGISGENLDEMRREPLLQRIVKNRLYVLFAAQKIGNRHLPPQRFFHLGKIARFRPGHRQCRFAQRLAWESARIHARPTPLMMTIDHGNGLVVRRGRGGGGYTRGTTTDDNQIIFFRFVGHNSIFRWGFPSVTGLSRSGQRECVYLRYGFCPI
jgi:hypothetical protein